MFQLIKNSGHNVHKAFVVQDKETQKNFSYGYAQFFTIEEAKKAQADLNNRKIMEKVLTVSLQSVNTTFNPKANVFVRNLAQKATQKDLCNAFETFGVISKCKLECYQDGTSREFGYVQFEDEKDANDAVNSMNGAEFQGKKLEVFIHQKRSENKSDPSAKQNNNMFV